MKKLVLAMTAMGALAGVLPGSAFAAITIGSNLGSSPAAEGWHNNPVFSQRTLLASRQAPGGLTSPINGVVVRWRVKAGSQSWPIRLRVLRPGGDGSEATGAGTSAAQDPVSDGITSFGLNPGLPVRARDGIGIESLDPGSSLEYNYWNRDAGAGQINFFSNLVDGGTPRPPDNIFVDIELLLQADIELDHDGDRLGDESQDPDGGNPPAPPAGPAPCTLLNLRILNIRIGNLVCL